MRSTAVLSLCLAVLVLSGCASEPSNGAGSSPQNHTPPTASEAPASSAQETLPTATGTFVSLDGQTTGGVEVTLEPFTEPDGSETQIATIRLTELHTPYDRLGVGGSTSPRGDDRCFDDGLRSGDGDIHPGTENLTTNMPAETLGHSLYEVVLIVNGEHSSSGWSECMNSVIARAPLTWSE